ncbi:unnamed protein product [Meloidogyne enterolobii]|uniref:Uncharacterized protein n=1 Tax=Meloidogyne enterolobii TaxID=390850 RepID=A0ACB0YRT4_MELEN
MFGTVGEGKSEKNWFLFCCLQSFYFLRLILNNWQQLEGKFFFFFFLFIAKIQFTKLFL